MAEPISARLRHAWNAFRARDETENMAWTYTGAQPYYQQTTRTRSPFGNERSIVTAVYNRIAMDVAAYDLQHIRLDQNGRYLETIQSTLNNCFSIEANSDQTGRAFVQDVVMSMFDEGVVAIVPVETTISPIHKGSYEILTVRTGKIMDWAPQHVRVEVYNEFEGKREQIVMPKNVCCIIENPLYAVMNEPNSTLRRLIRKLSILDAIDEQSGSGKLDIIIKLPYTIKTEVRQKQANDRRKSIEDQLAGSKYGIAYIDGTENVTQLNRPSENNLMSQITYLTNLLYNQLGLTEDVFTGKADERTMLNYYNRTIEPLVLSITEEVRRKFLTKTARTQGQNFVGFRDAFRLIPANELADMTDAFSRNEILTSNEIRSILGMKPSDAPQADELRNKNMPVQDQTPAEAEQPKESLDTKLTKRKEELDNGKKV